jgi:hypothetical protein
MQPESPAVPTSKGMLWAGWILTGLMGLLLLVDAGMKLVKPQFVVDATAQIGYPESSIIGLGVVLTACTVLYLIPRTAVLGAILLTGYLGGAVATHVRTEDGVFSVVLPVVFGALLWLGLYLRDANLRALVPLRN